MIALTPLSPLIDALYHCLSVLGGCTAVLYLGDRAFAKDVPFGGWLHLTASLVGLVCLFVLGLHQVTGWPP